MNDSNKFFTKYLPSEGRRQLRDCVTQTIKSCLQTGVTKVVMFTATGEGPLFTLRRFLPRPQYRHLELVAVTLPVGRPYPIDPRHPNRGSTVAGIAPAVHKFLTDSGVNVIAPERLPFSPDESEGNSNFAKATFSAAFGILGGGFSLGIQAVLVACDHGAVQVGERVATMTSDTSFFAIASTTELFLSPTDGVLVEHVICRPAVYDISKPHHKITRSELLRRSQLSPQLSLDDPEEED